jgi:hypothetical protein
LNTKWIVLQKFVLKLPVQTWKVDSKSAQEALKQIFEKRYHTKFDEPDYGHISKKMYAGLAFNTKEKRVSITYQVGNESQSNSVCSDNLYFAGIYVKK